VAGVIVYAVVYSNYDPAEVLALYDNEAAAKAHVQYESETGDWRVVPWSVKGAFVEPVPE
jgi:hypothetical protein